MRSGTIVSLITAPLTSAVAVIRISGDEAFLIAEKIFFKAIAGTQRRKIRRDQAGRRNRGSGRIDMF